MGEPAPVARNVIGQTFGTSLSVGNEISMITPPEYLNDNGPQMSTRLDPVGLIAIHTKNLLHEIKDLRHQNLYLVKTTSHFI